MVVSTSHLDPMDAFSKLVQQQSLQQQQSPAKLPKWFMPNIYKYFILLHDVTEGEESKYVENRWWIHRYYWVNIVHSLYTYVFLTELQYESKTHLFGFFWGERNFDFIIIFEGAKISLGWMNYYFQGWLNDLICVHF